MATTPWLFVTFGEPGMGLLPTTHGIGSKWTCWRLVRHLLPLIPLQLPGASASSPPCITKSDEEPASFTPVGNSADSPAALLRPAPATGHTAEILDV